MKDFRYNYIHSGKRVAKERKEMKYTQKELADKMGVCTKTISAIERGKNGISVATLIDLCKYLEVSTDYILFGYDTEINYVIQKKLKRLRPEQQKFVEQLVDKIIPLVQCMYEDIALSADKTMFDKTE